MEKKKKVNNPQDKLMRTMLLDRKKSKKANYKKPSVITITAYTGKGRWTVKDIEYNKSRLNGKTDTEYASAIYEEHDRRGTRRETNRRINRKNKNKGGGKSNDGSIKNDKKRNEKRLEVWS